jgi:hypothetical protein
MSNDTPANDEPQAAPDFNAESWTVLIGVRTATDPRQPGDMTPGLLFGMAATPEAMEQSKFGPRPDRSNEAVHFAQWLDEHKQHLVALWRPTYTQYMSLRVLSERGIPGLRVVGADEAPKGLLGADGTPLN